MDHKALEAILGQVERHIKQRTWTEPEAAEDYEWEARYLRAAISTTARILTAPDAEVIAPAPDTDEAGIALYGTACDALDIDFFETDIPGIPEDVPAEEIQWTAGMYRATFAPIAAARDLTLEQLLGQVVDFAERKLRLTEARLAFWHPATTPILPPGTPAPPDELLTFAEAATFLRSSIRTVRRYARSGELRASKNGRAVRFRKADIEAFLRSGRVG